MLVGDALDAGRRQQHRLFGQQRVGGGQRLAAFVEAVHFAGGHGHGVGVSVLQACVVELDVSEFLGFEGYVFLQAVHVVAEFLLRLPELLRLHFEGGQRLGSVVLLGHHGAVERGAVGRHAVERLLQLHERVVGFHIFAQGVLHVVDDVGAFGVVGAVEGVDVLMPFVQIADFLVVYLAVDAQAFDAVLHHQPLHHRGHYLFVDLVDAKGHADAAVVFGGPLVGKEVVAHARALAQPEGFVALHRVGVVELLVADAADFFGFEERRIVVVGCLEYPQQQVVRVGHHLVGGGQLHGRDGLHRRGHGVHQVLQDVFELLGLARHGVFQLVDLAEVGYGVVVAGVVKDPDYGVAFGVVGGIFVEEAEVAALGAHQRQVHRLDFGVVHAVGYGADGAVEPADVVALVGFLNRERVVVGVDAFGLVRRLDDGRFGGQLLHLCDGLYQQVVLARHLQRHVRGRHAVGVVHHKALVFVGHLTGHGHVGHAQTRHLVVAEDGGVLLALLLYLAVYQGQLLVVLALAHPVHEEGYDGQEPFPDVAFPELHGGAVFFELAYLLLDGFFLLHYAACGLFVVGVEQPGLVLIDVARIAEYFSGCHDADCFL